METSGPVIPPEFREHAFSEGSVLANSYRTREVWTLTEDGLEGAWHSVKGGLKSTSNSQPEILFSPDRMEWLKVATTNRAKDKYALANSAKIIETSLRLGGMDFLADQVRVVDINMNGVERRGFVTPHIGPSVEAMISYLRQARRGMDQKSFDGLRTHAKRFFEGIYNVAFDQAVQLYLNDGYWTGDPNPGNIVCNVMPEGSVRVALIDFGTRTQIRDAGFFQYVQQIAGFFQDQTRKHSIPFEANVERYRSRCQADRPSRKVGPRTTNG